MGIGWCELHQRASRPHATVAKLTQIDESRDKRLDADIIKQGAWGWERERRRRDDQISQPQLDPGFRVTNDGERIIVSQSTSAG